MTRQNSSFVLLYPSRVLWPAWSTSCMPTLRHTHTHTNTHVGLNRRWWIFVTDIPTNEHMLMHCTYAGHLSALNRFLSRFRCVHLIRACILIRPHKLPRASTFLISLQSTDQRRFSYLHTVHSYGLTTVTGKHRWDEKPTLKWPNSPRKLRESAIIRIHHPYPSLIMCLWNQPQPRRTNSNSNFQIDEERNEIR